jgi:hypothetical protein
VVQADLIFRDPLCTIVIPVDPSTIRPFLRLDRTLEIVLGHAHDGDIAGRYREMKRPEPVCPNGPDDLE